LFTTIQKFHLSVEEPMQPTEIFPPNPHPLFTKFVFVKMEDFSWPRLMGTVWLTAMFVDNYDIENLLVRGSSGET